MALFKKKTTAKKNVSSKQKKSVHASVTASVEKDYANILLRPRITEKAMKVAERNIFVFEVHPKASKYEIRDAIRAAYGVTPKAIRTTTQSPRSVVSRGRGRAVRIRGLKKAYVQLNDGDTINLA